MESIIANDPFDWTLPLPIQPINPTNLEGAGSICETKRFDSFYNPSGDRILLAAGQKYTSKKNQGHESALCVTTYWNSRQKLESTVLEVRSPHMKLALKTVIPEYYSFNIDSRHIKITDEPQCLFHYRQELLDYGAALQQHDHSAEAARHIQHLISYMWDVFAVELVAFSSVEWPLNGEASLEWNYLWMLFRPGDIVYVSKPHHQCFLFESIVQLGTTSWRLDGYCIDYDGVSFGFKSFNTTIGSYDGIKSLTDLEAVHFDRLSATEQQTVREQLLARGRKFVSIHGQQYLWFNAKSNESSETKMSTRIMADYKGYTFHYPSHRINLSTEKRKFRPEDALTEMRESDLMICNTYISGYSLRDNIWDTFYVDSIGDISFDSHAFDALILQEDQKQQILSLVRAHEDDDLAFDDLVKGKGRGMIFLLYGEPGVGKTLTAESVADYCRKPLLRLDAGTLGTTVHSVEKGLKTTFRMAESWHALLLLDEADVYLEQRKTKNLVHNGLVSVFLRMLEYYHGILFLTTNRIGSFDRAFMSRIHLAIHFPSLSQSSRRALWYTFLKQISQESAEALSRAGVLDKLAKEQLNGRQIKNLVRTACSLALGNDLTGDWIRQHHIESALRPMKQFAENMEKAQLFPSEEHRDIGEGRGHLEDQAEEQVAEDLEEEADEDLEGVSDVEEDEEGLADLDELDAKDDFDDPISDSESSAMEEQDEDDKEEDPELLPSKRRRLF